ncbi:MAG: secondary thiamine-phosphate synthase enzyme YjbQ [Cyanobacteria bacterium P01_H01_bin.15]
MKHHQALLTVQTSPKCLHRITRQVANVVEQAHIETGLCTVFIRHTSASLIIQENADPNVLGDLNSFFAKLVPEDSSLYAHSDEGPDDMPSHIRSVLTKTSEQIPVSRGQLVLGTWQGIYVWEHRSLRHHREIVVHVNGV